jgi:hypothetical protein
LSGPFFLAGHGNTLFVTNEFSGTVGEYDANTGLAINANFIMGLGDPVGIAVNKRQFFGD